MFWRTARVIAAEDARYGVSAAAVKEVARSFYELMTTGRFELNSPTLMTLGRPLGQLVVEEGCRKCYLCGFSECVRRGADE